MNPALTDLLSLLGTLDAQLLARQWLMLNDFRTIFDADPLAQRHARGILAELGFPGLLDTAQTAGPAPAAASEPEVAEVGFPGSGSAAFEPFSDEPEAQVDQQPAHEVLEVQDFSDLDFGATDTVETEQSEPSFDEPAADTLDLDLDLDLPEEPTQIGGTDEEEPVELELDLGDYVELAEEEGEEETVFSPRPDPLEPLPEPEEDVSDPLTLGDPDETEDLLREPSSGAEEPEIELDLPLFDEDDLLSDPVEIAEIEVEEPGQDALVTIEDTSDPRSDLEGLSRLLDSDLDDDPHTGDDEVIVRTTAEQPQEPESFDLMPDSDFSPDDEETFVADLSDIERMKAKMAGIEETDDPPSESEVLLPPPELSAPKTAPPPKIGGPRAVAAAGVAGVRAGGAPAVAGVRAGGAGPQVTPGLYGNPSVPQIRDRNAPKPAAAAIQIGAAQEQASMGGSGGSLLEEDEVLALGSVEDYGEESLDDGSGGGGLSLDVQEYEEAYEEEEEDDVDLEEVEPEPEPVFDDTVDPAEVKRVMAEADKAVEEGDMEAAIDYFSDAIDLDPDNVDAYVRRGRLHLDYGDYSRAMSDFMIAEELAPENPEPQIAVGDLYFARKDYSRAIGHFNGALKMDPNNAMAFCRRGISHYYRKRFAEALADLQQAQKIDDDIPNIRTYIAMARKKARR